MKKYLYSMLPAALLCLCTFQVTNGQSKTNSVSSMLSDMPALPAAAPYPNAKMEKGWRTLDGAESINVILNSRDNRTKVIDWYAASLSANGWKLNLADMKNFRISGRNNHGEFITVSATEAAAKSSRITVIYIKIK